MRAALALTATVALAAACGGGSGAPPGSAPAPPPPRPLTIRVGPARVTIPARTRARIAAAPAARGRRLLTAYIRRRATALRGPGWRLRAVWPARAIATVLRAARSPLPAVPAAVAVRSVHLDVPLVRQVYRDGCEAAALSMMLRERVGQRRLQAMLPVARPVEQESVDGSLTWGDPEQGFVGDVAGGGYGVYDRPLLALARRFDPGSTNLTGTSIARVVDALRHGRPVVAWIALGPSRPVIWRAPSGAVVHADWAEHAITLTGYARGTIAYNNPWQGTRERFTLAQFAAVWDVLGDRAIAGSSMIAGGGSA